MGDELLLGSEEGGFLELEALTPAVIASPASAAAAGAVEVSKHAATVAAAGVKPKTHKKSTGGGSKQGAIEGSEAVEEDRKKKKKKKSDAKADRAATELAGLKAKVAALQHGNAALKCAVPLISGVNVRCSSLTYQWIATPNNHRMNATQSRLMDPLCVHMPVRGSQPRRGRVPARSCCMRSCRAGHAEAPKQEKHIPADPNSARSQKLAAKKAKAKEVRNAKKQAAKARKQRAAERGQQQTGRS